MLMTDLISIILFRLLSGDTELEALNSFQAFLDSIPAIFLPDCSADDVRSFIDAAVSVKSTSTEIDEKFAEKFYWVDFEKVLPSRSPSRASHCSEKELLLSKR